MAIITECTLTENVLLTLEIRRAAYNLLRWTFLREPSKAFLNSLVNAEVLEQFPFQEENESIREGVNGVMQELKSSSFLSKGNYLLLHWDYTRMFIGPNKLPAPPWESAYTNKERLLFQEETLAVRRAYLKYAFIPVEYGHEADDHIGLELDFMYQLIELAIEKLQKNDTYGLRELLVDQIDFLEEHLLKWAPVFCQSVSENAETRFYRGMAKILEGYLNIDRTALAELVILEF